MNATKTPRRTRIKICGIRDLDMARAAAEAGADAIGIVLAPDSPRAVAIDAVVRLYETLPPLMTPIGVFRNQPREQIALWPGFWVQIHGDENEESVRAIRLDQVADVRAWWTRWVLPRTSSWERLPHRVVRGFPFSPAAVKRWDGCAEVDVLLVDGANAGEGRGFSWDQLAALMPQLRKPIVLAGGLTPDNVGDAIRVVRPYAVDVSSGVESGRGVKNATLIREFCAAVREADAARARES